MLRVSVSLLYLNPLGPLTIPGNPPSSQIAPSTRTQKEPRAFVDESIRASLYRRSSPELFFGKGLISALNRIIRSLPVSTPRTVRQQNQIFLAGTPGKKKSRLFESISQLATHLIDIEAVHALDTTASQCISHTPHAKAPTRRHSAPDPAHCLLSVVAG